MALIVQHLERWQPTQVVGLVFAASTLMPLTFLAGVTRLSMQGHVRPTQEGRNRPEAPPPASSYIAFVDAARNLRKRRTCDPTRDSLARKFSRKTLEQQAILREK